MDARLATNKFVRIYTLVPLITMPTPDFSMPFNVLCIVCSVVSVIFGSVHKSTTNFVTAIFPGSKKMKLLNKLKQCIFSIVFKRNEANCNEHDKSD